eukprot:4399220-Pyramimonas_sp.AAC.1
MRKVNGSDVRGSMNTGGPARFPVRLSDAWWRWHWRLRWSPLWGRETCEGWAESRVGDACGRWHWGLRWSSLRGHKI